MADAIAITGNTAISTFTPELSNTDGHITTTSVQVAQHFNRGHNIVLRSIRRLECSAEFARCNFAQSSYLNEQGKQQPMYRITKDGFMFLAMGFTGKEAAQWKEAYITAFNKMEAELNQALPAPTAPVAIEYARISPAQAQHLKELVHLVVESGKQGHGETWARLHRKMKVNSYLELGADKFDEACQYLRGKMDDQSMSDLLKKHFPQPVPNIAACLAAANLAAAGVQQSIFEQLMSGKGDMENGRWMLSFATSRDNKPMPYVNQIESDAVVMSLAYLANALNEPGGMLPSNAELANLASACNRRLSDRFTNESSRRVSA